MKLKQSTSFDQLEEMLLDLAAQSKESGVDTGTLHRRAAWLLVEYIEANRTTRITEAFKAIRD